jgi:threonine/homoserine/homoserine lactone efflux protein
LLVAVAPGAIIVASVQRTFPNGLGNALVFSLRVATSDICYLLSVYLGLPLFFGQMNNCGGSLSPAGHGWDGWAFVRHANTFNKKLLPKMRNHKDSTPWNQPSFT